MHMEDVWCELSKAVNYLVKFVTIFLSTREQEQLQILSDLALKHIIFSQQHCGVCKDEIEQNIDDALLCRQRLESDIEMKNKKLANTTCRLEAKEEEISIWERLVKKAHTEYKEKEQTYFALKSKCRQNQEDFAGLNIMTAGFGVFISVMTAGAATPFAIGLQSVVTIGSSIALSKAFAILNLAKEQYIKHDLQLQEYRIEMVNLQDNCKKLQNECDECRKEQQKNNEEHGHLLEQLKKATTLLECIFNFRHFISILHGRTEFLQETRKDIAFQHDLRLPLEEINKHLTSASSLNLLTNSETRLLCKDLSGQLMLLPDSFREVIKHIKKIEKKLCSGSERKEIALNAVDVGSLENFLLPAPISVAILGQLLAIASTIDFSLEKHVPIDGFKHVKQPGSFRACLVQISSSGCHAFTTAHTNMDKIRLYCMQFQSHVQNLVRIILKGSKQEKSTLAPIYLKDMMEKANKCLELAKKTESDFTGLTLLLSEVSMAAIAAKGLHESKLKEAMFQTQILEQRRERVQLQKREIEEEKLQVIEQLSVAKNAFDKIVDEIPGPMQTLGIATYEKTVNTLATGACIFGLSTLAAPVALTCVAAKGIVDIGKAFLGHKQKQKQGQSKEENKAAVKIALKNVPEIYALIRSLLANIESRLCQEKTKDDTKNTDEKQLQDDQQTKRDNDVNRINESFERYVKELDGSAFPNHEAVEVTRYLCKRSISVCVSLTQNQGCRVKIEDLFKEIKLCSDEAENVKIKSDLFFSAGSASCLNICVDSSNMDDKGMVQQANENVHTKIEIRKQNLEFMKRKQEAVKEKSQEINQQQCQLLEDLLKTDLQKVNFEEIIQTISQGMNALGRLEEQWHMMVAFFSYITNRIDVCISQDAHIFEQVLHGTGYTITAGTEDIILETAAGINSVAYSVGLIAQTYTDISGKHLVGTSAGLIGMIALHPDKDADTLNERRRELNIKCANAQLEIKKLAAERREMALNHITEQFERIQTLESELPVVEEDRKKKIQDGVAEGFEYVCNMERDESDYC